MPEAAKALRFSKACPGVTWDIPVARRKPDPESRLGPRPVSGL